MQTSVEQLESKQTFFSTPQEIKWVKPLCFGAVLVLLGDAHAVALSIQDPIVWQLTLPSLRLPAERRAEHSCVSL